MYTKNFLRSDLSVEHASCMSTVEHLIPVLLETDIVEGTADVGHRNVCEGSGIALRTRQHTNLFRSVRYDKEGSMQLGLKKEGPHREMEMKSTREDKRLISVKEVCG